jgi:hypothetical protein
LSSKIRASASTITKDSQRLGCTIKSSKRLTRRQQ